MKHHPIQALTLLLGLALVRVAHATTAADYYCSELPNDAAPIYFAMPIRSCITPQTNAPAGICSMNGNCIYITEEIKNKVKSQFNKNSIAELSEGERKTFLIGTYDWFPTTMICSPLSTGTKGVVCPMPEQCKAEMFGKPSIAQFDPEASPKAVERMRKREADYFPVKTDLKKAGPAK